MKIVHPNPTNKLTKQADQLLIGETGKVSFGQEHAGEILLRTHRSIVSLTDPNTTWSCPVALKLIVIPIECTLHYEVKS